MASFFLVSTCVVVCSCVPIGIRLYIVNNGFGESIVVRGSVDAVDCKVSGDCDSRIFPPGSDYGSRIVPTITIHVRNRSEDTVSLDVRMVKLGGTYGKYEFSGACGFDSPYPYTIVRVAPKTEKVAHISYRGKCDSLFSGLRPEDWEETKSRFVENEEFILRIRGLKSGERAIIIQDIRLTPRKQE
jgi:hypothetical protein